MFYLMVLSDAFNNPQTHVVAGVYTRKIVGVKDSHRLVEDNVADVATLYLVDKAQVNAYHDKGLICPSAIVFSTDPDLNPKHE